MGHAVLTDRHFRIDLRAEIGGNPAVEAGRRLAAGLPHLIGFQRALDDIGDRTVFPPCETVGKITRAGAADGKLRLCDDGLLQGEYSAAASSHQDGR